MNEQFELQLSSAVDRAGQLLSLAEVQSYPVDLERLAHYCGASVGLASLGSLDACLIPTPYKLLIKVNELKSHVRQRFCLAHEIGHLLLSETLAQPEFRGRGGNRSQRWRESACDYIAAELLLPVHLFLPVMKITPISALSIVRLAQLFDASVESTAIRYGNLIDDDVEVVIWERCGDRLTAKSASGQDILPKQSPKSKTFIPLRDTARVPVKAIGQRHVIVDREWMPPMPEPVTTEAKWLRFGSTDRVLSVTFRDGSESRVRGMQLVGKVLERQLVAAGRGTNDTGF